MNINHSLGLVTPSPASFPLGDAVTSQFNTIFWPGDAVTSQFNTIFLSGDAVTSQFLVW